MKLKKFRIHNFRLLVDSGDINVTPITVLIGPNESGKTSILQGLATLSMDSKYEDFDLTELDGIMKKYHDVDLLAENILIVQAEFELSEEEKEELKSIIGDPEANLSTIKISKYFDESYELNIAGKRFRIPSRYKFSKIQKDISSILTSLQNQAAPYFSRYPNTQFSSQFNEAINNATKLTKTEVISKEEALKLLGNLESFLNLGIEQQFRSDIQNRLLDIKKIIEKNFHESQTEVSLYNFLLTRMPRTVYFKSYERMEDVVSINELKNNPNAHKTFINFLKLAEIKLETLEKLDDKQKQVYLENGCGKATKLLREAWKQEVLDVRLHYSDGKLFVFTKNSSAIETLLPPSCGSEGFQWFFGFYINFGASTEAEYKRAILLLDDPGVFLHPKGHKDLLKLFEEYIQKDVTIIYSTHLPFLIPKENIEWLRLVQRQEGGRSHVTERFWAISDRDILYPLRANLGITLTDSLFIGENTIITEGVSGKILLRGMLKEFHRRNIRSIDLEKLEVVGAQGATKAIDIALLLEIENLPYVVILDNDEEGKRVVQEAEKRGLQKERFILLPQSQNEGQQNFEIEDLLPLEIYADAFYSIYESKGIDKQTILSKFKEGNEKIVNKAKNLLKSRNISDIDKVGIAHKILELISKSDGLDNKTIEIFTNLFDNINSHIKIYKDK